MKNTTVNTIGSRRRFLKLVGLSPIAATALVHANVEAGNTPHIVVIGGGFSGATCAKYLKMWGGSSVDVTIIETNPTYVSPILSNLVINGQKTIRDLTFDYKTINSKYKVNILYGTVESVNKMAKELTLDNQNKIKYDKLVLAAGIDFNFTNSYDITKVPHAWQSRDGIVQLQSQIDKMKNGDTFVMTIPASPFRCPPGPYERACVVADYLKNTKGYTDAKVIVLDANPKIIVEEDTFKAQFARYDIEYIPNATLTRVDDVQKSATYIENGMQNVLTATVLNVIPNQKAAPIVFKAGVNAGNWAPVNPLSYESVMVNDVYIIGDSQGTGQPKAGHIGNSEAKICADAILRKINNKPLYASPKTNSACYSPTSSNKASWLTAVYKYDPSTQKMVVANVASGHPTSKNYKKMFMWSGNLFADTFA